jgi:predicted DNA-binding protein (MmcQ/YjbR family)
MTRLQLNAFCRAFPGAHHVVQWGGCDVWKVGPKIFAVGGWDVGDYPAVTFKVTGLGWQLLHAAPGCRPAPYLASRGLRWIQVYAKPGLKKAQLEHCVAESYALVVSGLPAKTRATLTASSK